MKPAQIFHQYIWIISVLSSYKRLTLEEISEMWIKNAVADGKPLYRSSFNRHRDAILDMFGIIIDCEPKTYKYYISNREVLSNDSIERWLFSTLTVHGVLADSASVKERLVLECAPAGKLPNGIQSVAAQQPTNRIFDLQGRQLCPATLNSSSRNTPRGLFIIRQGDKVRKVMMK